ncbi:Z-ring formation inhibitor MciZ [Paenibacillus sp. YPG26]|uniref:Z-ring formation inhibitor MciZ n=1 Tax=Paenibacillus sp. YPG26 TaxID=2878915 RepID=UPI00320847E6
MVILYQIAKEKEHLIMKSYFADTRFHISGKAWQVKALLSNWKKNIGPDIQVKDLITISLRKK